MFMHAGCGPVGLLAIGIAKVMGATKVYVYLVMELAVYSGLWFLRYAADIVNGRLKSAKLLGADVVINCSTENLKERSKESIENTFFHQFFV